MTTVKGSAKTRKVKKRNFSSFTKKEAFKQLAIENLLSWTLTAEAHPVSDFFQERLLRLKRHFDLETCEESKKLLIDAVCEEALEGFDRLKVWKGANLQSDTTIGIADYLVTERKGYLEAPFLCIIEAKKDDFEQGLAQCLVEMQACQWENQQVSANVETQKLAPKLEILGIVTNGSTWQFYRLTPQGEAYETSAFSIGDLEMLLGRLRFIFQRCENNLAEL